TAEMITIRTRAGARYPPRASPIVANAVHVTAMLPTVRGCPLAVGPLARIPHNTAMTLPSTMARTTMSWCWVSTAASATAEGRGGSFAWRTPVAWTNHDSAPKVRTIDNAVHVAVRRRLRL